MPHSIAYSGNEIVTTPVIGTTAYAAGQQVGGVITIPKAALDQGRLCQLMTVNIVDFDKQNSGFSVLLFNQSPTLSSVNGQTFSQTNANMAAQCIGQFTVQSSDYVAVGTQGVASIPFSPAFFAAGPQGNLYAVLISGGAPTYTTTGSLVVRWIFTQHY